jgi:predicted RNA-binding Zn-ribbon protein involved in translation (DUF1610 family)
MAMKNLVLFERFTGHSDGSLTSFRVQLIRCPKCGAAPIVSSWSCRGEGPDDFPDDIVCPKCPDVGLCGHDFQGQGLPGIAKAWNCLGVDVRAAFGEIGQVMS